MLSENGGAKRILVLSQADHEFFDEIQKSGYQYDIVAGNCRKKFNWGSFPLFW